MNAPSARVMTSMLWTPRPQSVVVCSDGCPFGGALRTAGAYGASGGGFWCKIARVCAEKHMLSGGAAKRGAVAG